MKPDTHVLRRNNFFVLVMMAEFLDWLLKGSGIIYLIFLVSVCKALIVQLLQWLNRIQQHGTLKSLGSGLILQNCSLLDILLKAVIKSNKAALATSFWKQKDKHKINGWPASALQWRKATHVSQITVQFFLEQIKLTGEEEKKMKTET